MINWDEAPKGTTDHGQFGNLKSNGIWYQIKDDRVLSWSISGSGWSNTFWKPEELTANNEGNVTFTPRPEVNPVYTQEMHEAGELPSVGMECLTKYKHQDDTMWLSCFIVGLNKDGDYLVFEHTIRGLDQHHIKDGVYDFKPLTTPVKLIDGKAYLVTHKGNGHEYEVLYLKATDSFFSSKIDHPSRFFTNIQPLTVEEK